jgi:N-ethylmaleimide reductase
MKQKPDLCEPFHSELLGKLSSRIVMSAMTRGFCGPNHTATAKMADYYSLRAMNKVGLIISEGTIIHRTGDGYNNVPHIETEEQINSWRQVTKSVHKYDTKIFCQLWHCGRISHSDYLEGKSPLSSTNKQASGINKQNNKPFGIPKAMDKSDISVVVDQYVQAALNALKSDFDGVELHFGHGYLIDQFLDSRVNDRTDHYGGSIENRSRLALEIVEAVISSIGSSRVIVRISPSRFMNGLYEWPNMNEMLEYLLREFDNTGLRMLDVSCANADYYQTSGKVCRLIRRSWRNLLIGGASLTGHQAQEELADGILDMVTWGRLLISNPDLYFLLKSAQDPREFEYTMLSTLDP